MKGSPSRGCQDSLVASIMGYGGAPYRLLAAFGGGGSAWRGGRIAFAWLSGGFGGFEFSATAERHIACSLRSAARYGGERGIERSRCDLHIRAVFPSAGRGVRIPLGGEAAFSGEEACLLGSAPSGTLRW